jgi:cytochrome P450
MASLQELIMSGKVTFFALGRHDEVSMALRDPSFSSDSSNWEGAELIEQPTKTFKLQELMSRWMLFLDPPDHTRIRSLVNKAFTARRVEALRPRIHELTDELLDEAAGRTEIDVLADFAFTLPIRVISELLGVPRDDQAQFRDASRNLASVLDVGQVPDEVLEAADPFVDYIRSLVEDRRRSPGDDLLSALIAARDSEDELSDAELMSTVSLVFGAGFETTMNLIGNGIYLLLEHPDQLRRLQAEPSLIGSTVEEILRLQPPVLATARTLTNDMQIGDRDLHKGQQGILLLAAANKDHEVFDDPLEFDIARNPNPHMTFGGGHHFCPGAALARLEGQIAIGSFFTRFPDARLREEPEWRQSMTLHGLNELWVELARA